MRLAAILLALSCFAVAFHVSVHSRFVNPYARVCSLVNDKIYEQTPEVVQWQRMCWQRSRLVKPWTPRHVVFQDIQVLLQKMSYSHLGLYAPSEKKWIWQGVVSETGIESRFVEGTLVVTFVHPGSPAQKAGIRQGDIIISYNEEHPNPLSVSRAAGNIVYERIGVLHQADLKTASFQKSQKVKVSFPDAQTAWIQVPSFREEFFRANFLRDHLQNLNQAKTLIVDLRGNAGGNFVAGLRFLSNFFCSETEIGELLHPKAPGKKSLFMPDALADAEQLKIFSQTQKVVLKTFRPEFCLQKNLVVLTNNQTASVAEMVAQALKEKKSARVWGELSAGLLMVGVWYPMSELGNGVLISIPEGIYESKAGQRLEKKGVAVDKVLYDDLRDWQRGEDSWIQQVIRGAAKS